MYLSIHSTCTHYLLSLKKKRDAELVYYVKPGNLSSPPNYPNYPILIPHEVSLRTRLDRLISSPARSFQFSYFRFQPILLLVSCLPTIGDYYPGYSFLSIPIPIPIRPVLSSTNSILYLSYFLLLLSSRQLSPVLLACCCPLLTQTSHINLSIRTPAAVSIDYMKQAARPKCALVDFFFCITIPQLGESLV